MRAAFFVAWTFLPGFLFFLGFFAHVGELQNRTDVASRQVAAVKLATRKK
jgi:hypothetical protein